MFTKKRKFTIPNKVVIEEYYGKEVMPIPVRLKVLFAKVERQVKPYIGIIIPADFVSPMTYENETWEIVKNALNMLEIEADEVEFYLDFKEMIETSPDFMKCDYEISETGNLLSVSYFKSLEQHEIPLYVSEVREQYYNPTQLQL